MTGRINPFATLKDVPEFSTKPKKETPVAEEAIARIAEENNFPSRQATKVDKESRRTPRRYRTGRNKQLNIKSTEETSRRLSRIADERGLPLGKILELALDALERVGEGL